MVSADHRGAHGRRPVRRVRPDAARPRADPRGVRRPAARACTTRGSPTRRTRSSSSSRGGAAGGRRWAAARAGGGSARRRDAGPLPRSVAGRPDDPRRRASRPVARRGPGPGRRRGPRRRAARRAPASIGLILSDDAELAELNATHLGKTRSDRRPVLPAPAARGVPGRTRAGAGADAARAATPGLRRCRPAAGRISATSSISVERAIEQAAGRPRRPDRRRRWSPADELRLLVDPRRPARLRLGPRRAGRGGGDARPRARLLGVEPSRR